MTTLCHSTTKTLETLTRDYALRDSKGREIGGRFTINETTYVPAPAGSLSGHPREPGVAIIGAPHATRNGVNYGASQRRVEYPTMEAARNAAAQYFAKAAKRAGHR